MEERRRSERVSLLLEVYVEGLSGQYTARISDISLGGCYIESIMPVAIGERVQFKLQLLTGRWMLLRGEVINYQPSVGFGVRFVDLTMMERNVLKNVLDQARR